MKQLSYIFLYILCTLILQCSGNEKSKIVDIYPDGSPKEIEVYKGNPPKMELNKILHISSFGDTSMIVNIEDGDTLIPEINKEIIKSKFKNGQSMIVDHWKIIGHSETLIEIHYFDETGDILKIDDKVNNRVKKYAELHPELERWDKPENNPLKNYLHGFWHVESNFTGENFLSEFKGGSYVLSKIDKNSNKIWEEIYGINYNWYFNLDLRMLNKGFPQNRIKPGKRISYQLKIDTKDKFEMENERERYTFIRKSY